MFSITYQTYPHQIKNMKDKNYIFDVIRKKWLMLTPEEWVRQNFLHYLITDKDYPRQSIAVEKEIMTFENKKRFDIVVYDEGMQPFLIVECKSQKIALTELVVQQVLNYNSVLQTKYIIITNGNFVVVWDCVKNQALNNVPIFKT